MKISATGLVSAAFNRHAGTAADFFSLRSFAHRSGRKWPIGRMRGEGRKTKLVEKARMRGKNPRHDPAACCFFESC
jgi:hypothetical protein